ncbi:MAG: hypothetical protein QNJ72_23195 [Pleurocapsa sp. MO_226.B13]|nr:hypothetical protein [Pleurocapsa sp. MO_226.B13]
MNTKVTPTLWSDVERSRFFLIPGDRKIPPGDFPLRTITGRQMEVDPKALETFEISREEAKNWLNSQFGQVIEEAKGKFTNYLGNLGKSATQSQPDTEVKTSSKTAYTSLSLLSELTGEPVENLQTEPDAIARSIRHLLSDLIKIWENSTAANAEQLQTARNQIKNVKSIFQAHGIMVSEKLDEIPDQLHEFYFSPHTQNSQEKAANLEQLADQLEQTAVVAGTYLRTMAQQLREPENISIERH